MNLRKLNERLVEVLNEWIDDSLPENDKEEVFDPKKGDTVYVLGNEGEEDFYGVVQSIDKNSVNLRKLVDHAGNSLSGTYVAHPSQLYNGEGINTLIEDIETTLKSLKDNLPSDVYDKPIIKQLVKKLESNLEVLK